MKTAALLAVLLVAFAPLGARAAGMSGQRVSGKAIAALATAQLAHLIRRGDTEFVPASTVSDQIVSDGRVHLRAQSPMDTPSFVNVPVQIEVDGRLDRTVLVGYRVQQYVQTAIASRDLVAGTVLAADDLRLARVPFTGQPGNGTDALVGRKLNFNALKGQAIALGQTAIDQIVKAGSTVVFIVRDGSVAVTADAIARTGGGLGEQVFVFNPQTLKQLSGTVTGPGTVELNITGGSTP